METFAVAFAVVGVAWAIAFALWAMFGGKGR